MQEDKNLFDQAYQLEQEILTLQGGLKAIKTEFVTTEVYDDSLSAEQVELQDPEDEHKAAEIKAKLEQLRILVDQINANYEE